MPSRPITEIQFRATNDQAVIESILCTVQDGTHCGNYMSFGIAKLGWQIISRYSLP